MSKIRHSDFGLLSSFGFVIRHSNPTQISQMNADLKSGVRRAEAQMEATRLVIGLMSGTSLDGVDAALVEITGSAEGTRIQLQHFISVPFASDVQAELLRVAAQTPVAAQVISHLNFLLATLYTEAVERLCLEADVGLN